MLSDRMLESLESAYWAFDARRKGYGQWASAPQSERDAFKAAVMIFVGELRAEAVGAHNRAHAAPPSQTEAKAA